MEAYIAEITSMVEDGYTHEHEHGEHGFSARSVKRFFSEHDIHYRSNLSVQKLD